MSFSARNVILFHNAMNGVFVFLKWCSLQKKNDVQLPICGLYGWSCVKRQGYG